MSDDGKKCGQTWDEGETGKNQYVKILDSTGRAQRTFSLMD